LIREIDVHQTIAEGMRPLNQVGVRQSRHSFSRAKSSPWRSSWLMMGRPIAASALIREFSGWIGCKAARNCSLKLVRVKWAQYLDAGAEVFEMNFQHVFTNTSSACK
jgi:hypothetical protein